MVEISISDLARHLSGEVVNSDGSTPFQLTPCASSAKVVKGGSSSPFGEMLAMDTPMWGMPSPVVQVWR